MNQLSRHIHTISAGIVGVICFGITYGFSVLNPTYIDWIMAVDSGIHYVNWIFLRNADWTFPFNDIPDLLVPMGMTVSKSDMIPLLALPLKIFSPILPEVFQYHGVWLLSVFILQGVFGYKLIAHFVEDKRFAVIGSVLFVLSPHFLYRNEIAMRAMGTHWVILASFYYFLVGVDNDKKFYRMIVLNLLTVYIHPYLVAMVLPVSVGGILYHLWGEKKKALRYVGMLLVFECFAMASLGYFSISAVGGFGFRIYSADFFTLFNSMLRGRIPFYNILPEQHEGFAYLGSGILLGLLIIIGFGRSALKNFRKDFWILGSLCFLMFIFSLSSYVTAGGTFIVDLEFFYAPFTSITSAFRSSGRFAGPLHFWIFLALIVCVYRRFPKFRYHILVVILAVQIFDLSHWIFNRSTFVTNYKWNRTPSPEWNSLASGRKDLVMIPARVQFMNCYGIPLSREGYDYEDVMSFSVIAARHRMTINSGIDPRADNDEIVESCAVLPLFVQSGKFGKETLFAVHQLFYEKFLKDTVGKVKCKPLDNFYACASDL